MMYNVLSLMHDSIHALKADDGMSLNAPVIVAPALPNSSKTGLDYLRYEIQASAS